jgi:diadenosine tetraphosphatase ApaH/serine/threonine PP2A family protein phosphatase
VLALLYDIHGNLTALEAVIADAERRGARRYLLGGDYTLFGGMPPETLERLRELPADWIRGNGERWTAHPEDAPDLVRDAIDACRELLGEDVIKEMDCLPEQAVIHDTRFCHASPVSDVRSFYPEPAEDEPELLAGIQEPRLAFGHTHVQFARTGPIELINPGSVGMPLDGDRRAAYALLAPGREVELLRVEYDWQAAAAATRDRLGDTGELPARRIEQARFDVV